MKTSINKRLAWIELVLAQQDEPEAIVIDFSVFTDEELERLDSFAVRRDAWIGDDWLESGLSSAECRELDALMAKVN